MYVPGFMGFFTTVVFPHRDTQSRKGPGLKALKDSASFMGLKAHAPSVISDLQLRHFILYIACIQRPGFGEGQLSV
jgi:hypothetical protein